MVPGQALSDVAGRRFRLFAEIGLLSRGSQVRVLPGVPKFARSSSRVSCLLKTAVDELILAGSSPDSLVGILYDYFCVNLTREVSRLILSES